MNSSETSSERAGERKIKKKHIVKHTTKKFKMSDFCFLYIFISWGTAKQRKHFHMILFMWRASRGEIELDAWAAVRSHVAANFRALSSQKFSCCCHGELFSGGSHLRAVQHSSGINHIVECKSFQNNNYHSCSLLSGEIRKNAKQDAVVWIRNHMKETPLNSLSKLEAATMSVWVLCRMWRNIFFVYTAHSKRLFGWCWCVVSLWNNLQETLVASGQLNFNNRPWKLASKVVTLEVNSLGKSENRFLHVKPPERSNYYSNNKPASTTRTSLPTLLVNTYWFSPRNVTSFERLLAC